MANREWEHFHRIWRHQCNALHADAQKEALPEKIWFYPIDHADKTATFQALDSNYK